MRVVVDICSRERRSSRLVGDFSLLKKIYLDRRQTMGEASYSFARDGGVEVEISCM